MTIQSQGRALIALLKRRPMSYHDMLMTGLSVCPWKRVAESIGADEQLRKGKNASGLTTWRIVKG